MGPKKRRGRKQSPEARAVTGGATEAVTLVTGDDGTGEVQTLPDVEPEEHVAQVLPPVASDRKLSSAVLVLENCLLTTPQPQPRIDLTSSDALNDIEQPVRPGRKKQSLGIRRGVARKALSEAGRQPVVHGNPGETQKPKQRAIRKQTRQRVPRVPRRKVDVESSVMATVVVDDPSSDVDVESGGILADGDLCPEDGEILMAKDGEEMPSIKTFPEKKKRKKAFKREKHANKRRRKDDVVVSDERQEPEEIKVDEEEEEEEGGDEEEGENYATWMVSPLCGDEERMIFKRQRKILTPDFAAGDTPGQCPVPVPADVTADLVGNVPESQSPLNAMFVDPMEGDTQEDVDVEAVCLRSDETANTDFTSLAVRKGRINRKKTDSKAALQSIEQSESEIIVTGVDGASAGQKRRKPARKNPRLREVEASQEPGAALGTRVTRSRRNGNGNGGTIESGSLSADTLLGSGVQNTGEEVRLEADSLEGRALQVDSVDVISLEEPDPRETAVVEQAQEESSAESKAADGELKERKKKRKKKPVKAEDRPTNIAGSDEDRSSGESPKLETASIQSSEANVDETREIAQTGNYPAAVQEVANEPTASSVCVKDAENDVKSDDAVNRSSLVDRQTLQESGKDQSPSSETPFSRSEEDSQKTSHISPEQKIIHSDSASMSTHSLTGEKSGGNLATAGVTQSLSLECYSERTSEEASATSNSEQSSVASSSAVVCGAGGCELPRGMVDVPPNTVAPQRGDPVAVVTADGDSVKKEDGKVDDAEIAARDVEILDANTKDDCLAVNRKPDPGVGGGGDDVGFIPLKKRRLRLAETAAEPVAAADGEKPIPVDASSDLRNPIDLAPVNNLEMTTADGQRLGSPDLLTSAVSCTRANKFVGAHVVGTPGDLAGAVHRASQLGARALGIFVKPQKTLTPPPLDPREAAKFKEALKEKGYSPHMVVPHGSFLLNCGASDAEHLSRSRESLVDDLKRCEMLGLPLFNFHPGAHSDSDNADDCVLRVADSINYAHSKVADVITVIENMSGEANSVGSTFEQLKRIIDGVVDKSRVAVCLDTCHAFAAGFDLRDEVGYRKLMDDFDRTIGRQYLRAVHINDSQGDLGSRVDHHAPLGKGKIGLTCFRLMMSDRSLENIPLILETPVTGHRREIELLYSFIPRTE